jgi:type IV pilus assembly protein PilY1
MTNVVMAVTLLWSASQSTHLSAAPLNLPDVPLVVSTTVSPNILVLIDNSGSMSNIVPDAPYDATASQSCPLSNVLPTPTTTSPYVESEPNVDVSISSTGTPSFRYNNGSTLSWGTSGTSRCFVPTRTYNARLYGDVGSPAQPVSYLDAAYTGHYLNWYFGSAPTNWGLAAQRKPGTLQRIEIARTAGKQLVEAVSNVRMGLATYNGDTGATIKVGMADLTIAQKTLMKTGIDALVPTGQTPLAESLQDIGRYFVQGFNNTS